MSSQGSPARTLLTLQALRALAACAVVLFHALDAAERYTGLALGPLAVFELIGSAGVDLFFVISGFVMIYTTRALPKSPASASYFMMRRVVRIVPLYWLLSLLMAFLLLALPQAFNRLEFQPAHLAASLFFIPWPNNLGEPFPILGVGWSLNYEMFFYVIMALVLWCARLRLLTLTLVMVPLALIGMAVRPQHLIVQALTHNILLEFWMGAVVAELVHRRRLPYPRLLAAAGLAIFIAGVGVVSSGAEPPRAFAYGLGLAIMLAGLVAHEMQKGARVPRLLVVLGDCSYALYLIHPLVLAVCAKLWRAALGPTEGEALAALLFVISLPVGYAVWRWLEKPMNAGIMHWLFKRNTLKRPVAAAQPIEA